MAVQARYASSTFLGLSSDDKPDAAPGSKFLELDTGIEYICITGTTWQVATGVVVGQGARVTATRPANTTAYTAGDVVGATAAALTFPVGFSGGEVLITSAALEVDLSAVPSGMSSFTLQLYSVTPPSALADNAAWDLPSGDRASYLGSVSLGSPVDVGSTLYVEVNGINKQISAASGDIYGYLVTAGGYTPSSGEVYAISLHTVRV